MPANRPNRKSSDEDILKMNAVGLSLSTIAKMIGCHPTSVTLRLKGLGVPPADTRRTFMEDIFVQLPRDHQDWLAEHLYHNDIQVKDYVRQLMENAYLNQQGNTP